MNIYFFLIVTALFVGMGIMFFFGKGLDIIAGYNTLPESERSKYDKKGFGRFMGLFMFALCVCWLFVAIGSIISSKILLIIGIILVTALCVFSVVYLNTGNRFKNQ